MIGRSKELEDVGRVASSFPTFLGKIEATLPAGYLEGTSAIFAVMFSREVVDPVTGCCGMFNAEVYFNTEPTEDHIGDYYNDMKNDDPWDADNQTHSKYTEYDWLNVTGVMSTDPETLYTKVTVDIFEAP